MLVVVIRVVCGIPRQLIRIVAGGPERQRAARRVEDQRFVADGLGEGAVVVVVIIRITAVVRPVLGQIAEIRDGTAELVHDRADERKQHRQDVDKDENDHRDDDRLLGIALTLLRALSGPPCGGIFVPDGLRAGRSAACVRLRGMVVLGVRCLLHMLHPADGRRRLLRLAHAAPAARSRAADGTVAVVVIEVHAAVLTFHKERPPSMVSSYQRRGARASLFVENVTSRCPRRLRR